jgi:predicted dehydrogenase
MESNKIKVACVGAGYFAKFHVEAWSRIPEVELVAICDLDKNKTKLLAQKYGISNQYQDIDKLIAEQKIDVIDIITPPATHLSLCEKAAINGINIICQKPMAPSLEESIKMVDLAKVHSVKFVVHENWRFQPWYRKIKELIDRGKIGKKLHSIYFRMRMGDGWGEDAYLGRQPYFRTMPRLLVYETGIHFIDTYRYLAGEIESVYADLRKLNQGIAGEDCGMVIFNFKSGARGVWDANRYNESDNENARYTFGEMLVEGDNGSIRLYNNGKITIQSLGSKEAVVEYFHEDINFTGDSVYYFQQNFVDCYMNDKQNETSGKLYIQNLVIQEAIYLSSKEKRVVNKIT